MLTYLLKSPLLIRLYLFAMSESPLFNIGDFVQLNSGGPTMRVFARSSSNGRGMMAGFNEYGCVWYDNEKRIEKNFQESDLVLVQKKA
jgi:uncharacterized protein YodC (DUF2158 family)